MATATKPRGAMPKGPMHGRGMRPPKGAIKKGTFGRLMKMLLKYYKWRLLLVAFCLVFSAAGSLVSSFYMQQVVDGVITPALDAGGITDAISQKLIGLIVMMATV